MTAWRRSCGVAAAVVERLDGGERRCIRARERGHAMRKKKEGNCRWNKEKESDPLFTG
jgi:hypothetical protein